MIRGRKTFLACVLCMLLSAGAVSVAFADGPVLPVFEFAEAGYSERVLTEAVARPELITLTTVVADSYGVLYYLATDMEAVLASIVDADGSYAWEDLENTEYTVTIARIDRDGTESVFAEGRLPLTTSVEGLLFNREARRMLVFLKTIALDEEMYPFLAATLPKAKAEIGTPSGGDETAGTKAWNWTGLENCFTQAVSILEITGFRTPFPL